MRWVVCAGVFGAALLMAGAPVIAQVTPSAPKSSARQSRGVRVIQPDSPPGPSDANVSPVVTPGPAPSPGPVVADPSKTSVTPVTHSIMHPCERPFAKADLTFSAQSDFDRSLSSALKARKAVVVDLAEPYGEKDPPPSPLAPWFSAVKSGGGAVTVAPYCTGGRGFMRNWLMDVVQRLTGRMYAPAREFNVTLYEDAAKKRVTQLEFKPKSAAVAASR